MPHHWSKLEMGGSVCLTCSLYSNSPEIDDQRVACPQPKAYASKDGAKQSHPPLRFQDLNLSLLRRIASAMTEGWEKRPTDREAVKRHTKDYLESDTEYALTKLGNAMYHLLQLNDVYLSKLRGCPQIAANEDHLGHCAANLNMLAEWERTGLLPSSEPDTIVQEPSKLLKRANTNKGNL